MWILNQDNANGIVIVGFRQIETIVKHSENHVFFQINSYLTLKFLSYIKNLQLFRGYA